MAQPSEIYVDPAIDDDTGLGTEASPYGDLEWAIEKATFDTTNGTRINIKAGTDEVLAGTITAAMADTGTTAAWVPAETAPLVIQGYTSAAGDGGIGGVDCNASSPGTITTGAGTWQHFIEMHIHNNATSSDMMSLGSNCSLIRCELNNSNGIMADPVSYFLCLGCYFHDGGNVGLRPSGGYFAYNYFENGAKKFTTALGINTTTGFAYRNIIKVDGSSDGISLQDRASAVSNSIWSDGGTGSGIVILSNRAILAMMNNLVEGFSGSGGKGYDFSASGASLLEFAGNAAYNNETDYDGPEDYYLDRWGNVDTNEVLTASPFKDAANKDFSPVDIGLVKEGSLPFNFGNGII